MKLDKSNPVSKLGKKYKIVGQKTTKVTTNWNTRYFGHELRIIIDDRM